MTKKRGMIFFSLLMAAVALLNLLETRRYTYTNTEKYHRIPMAPDTLADNFVELVSLHDVIIEGTVLSEASAGTLIREDDHTFSIDYYKVAVKNIWYGECPSMVITLWVQRLSPNDLHKNDRIVFAARTSDLFPQNSKTIYLADHFGICVLNPPDNRTFFVSDVYPPEYDGLTVPELKNELQLALDDVALHGFPFRNYAPVSPPIGKIAAPYYEKYLENHPEEKE